VFGVSSDEYLNYAQQNRNEWAERGEEIVEVLAKDAEAEYLAANPIVSTDCANETQQTAETSDSQIDSESDSNISTSLRGAKVAIENNKKGASPSPARIRSKASSGNIPRTNSVKLQRPVVPEVQSMNKAPRRSSGPEQQ